MNSLTKGDLYCNFKWLHKLVRFSETIVTEDGVNVKLILLSRHKGFRFALRTSKTKFKKISAEELNVKKNFCLNLCKLRMDNKVNIYKYSTNYHILFINYHIKAVEVIENMNIMLRKIIDYYYPKLSKDDSKFNHNEEMREMLSTKWTLDLSNSLDEEYMESQYNSDDKGVKNESLV